MSEISQKQQAQAKNVFLRCSLFDGVEPSVVENAFSGTKTVLCQKGEQLYKNGCLCFLLSGKAKVYAQSGSTVMRNLEPGEFFGAASLFCKEDAAGSVTAASPCTMAYMPENAVSNLIEASARFGRNYIGFLSDRIRFLNRKIYNFTGVGTEQRVLNALRGFADQNGKVVLPFSMGELANRLNIGRSSLYRAIDNLVASNELEKNKNIYIKGEKL